MPISIRIKDYDFGDIVYLRTDMEQLPWEIDHVIATPIGIMFALFKNGEVIEVYEHQFTKERDMVLVTGGQS